MRGVEREREPERLVALALLLPRIALSTASRNPRTHRRARRCGLGRPALGRLPTAFLTALVSLRLTTGGALPTDPGERDPGLAQRHGRPVPRFHAVHEFRRVAGRSAGKAAEEPLGEVHRTAGFLVRVEGAPDLHLVALPHGRKAVVGEDGAEIRAALEGLAVYSSGVWHGATTTLS